MITDERDYYTVAEAARLLRVSRPTVWRWIDSGRLPAYRVGGRTIRIRRADLEAAIEPARPRVAMMQEMERYTIRQGDDGVDADELLARLRRGKEQILAERGGRPLPPSAPLIREAREERAAGR